ncbi:MAG TPA: DoxX family protein [Bacteroidia bacterium]|jgi:hypothetical protein|nr:DoxX family protein [Bacteroidia bacterium]
MEDTKGNKGSIMASTSKGKVIAYWITTGIIALQVASGAYFDLTKFPDFSKIAQHLGYPIYLLTILGVARVFALLALLAPRFPRLKEWAYAGLFFEYSLALVSHITVGDNAIVWIWPLIFAGILIASWYLRPTSRRLA